MEDIIEKDEFDIMILENIMAILRPSPVTGLSDRDHFRQRRLQARGYWVTVVKLFNTELGAFVARDRWWLVATRILLGDPEKIQAFFHNIIRACTVDEAMFEPGACIDFYNDARERRTQQFGLPSLSGTGERVSKRGDKEDTGCKDVHYDYQRGSAHLHRRTACARAASDLLV